MLNQRKKLTWQCESAKNWKQIPGITTEIRATFWNVNEGKRWRPKVHWPNPNKKFLKRNERGREELEANCSVGGRGLLDEAEKDSYGSSRKVILGRRIADC